MNNISIKLKWVNFCCVASVLTLSIVAPTLSFAGKSSYPGLIASPNQDTNSRGQKQERQGYKGLISGRTDTKTGKNRNQQRIDLLKERRQKEIVEARQDREKQEEYSQQKSKENYTRHVEIDDKKRKLRDLRYYSSKVKIAKESEVATRASKSIKVSDRVARILSRGLRKIDGMFSTEYKVKSRIDELFRNLDDDISSAERRENAKVIQEDLELLADAYYQKKSTPDSIYEDLGLPEKYVEDQKVAIDASIVRINQALKEVRRYL